MNWNLYDAQGIRKYLTREETRAFLDIARREGPALFSFCCLMAHSGCRISEALAMTADNIDFMAGAVSIECLKKRRRQVYRSVPLPAELLENFGRWFDRGTLPKTGRLWPWSRMTAYRRIRDIMARAGIRGSHACPKGLRHGFGVQAIQAQVPLNLVQRWLGHADIKTTTIYTSVIGPEERAIAARMWGNGAESGGADLGAKTFSEQLARLAEPPARAAHGNSPSPKSFSPMTDSRLSGPEWLEATIQTLLALQQFAQR